MENLKRFLKSPMNYTGGKYKLLSQIIPLFPESSGIDNFIDLFCGGCNVGINISEPNKKIVFNDNLTYLINLYKKFQINSLDETLSYIENRIKEYDLSKTNENAYLKFREDYNKDNSNSLDLYIILCHSFNHQLRFNNKHEVNISFGQHKSGFNDSMKTNLISFINKIKSEKIIFTNYDFKTYSKLVKSKNIQNDFYYIDPPYLITTGSYNDGKRGFEGWTLEHEKYLLDYLSEMNNNKIRFALSNVFEHKGLKNDLLINWSKNFNIHYLNMDYNNSNYQLKNNSDNKTIEVLITNY